MAIDKELIEILACPKCKGDVVFDEDKNCIVCENCKLKYEVRDDIPIMLPEEALPLEN